MLIIQSHTLDSIFNERRLGGSYLSWLCRRFWQRAAGSGVPPVPTRFRRSSASAFSFQNRASLERKLGSTHNCDVAN
jgi:hypothetical protein